MVASWTSLARGPRPYPLTTLSFILWLTVMNPSLIYCHQTQQKSSFDLKRFIKALHTDAPVAVCLSPRDLGTQRAVSLRIPKRSCKIVETLPCEMPNACAISSTWIRLSQYTRSRISYTFFRRWHQVGVQTWLHLLKTFYHVWIPLPKI